MAAMADRRPERAQTMPHIPRALHGAARSAPLAIHSEIEASAHHHRIRLVRLPFVSVAGSTAQRAVIGRRRPKNTSAEYGFASSGKNDVELPNANSVTSIGAPTTP